jgi:poly(glycerol-phosphate) alpha-glucosyltransferase
VWLKENGTFRSNRPEDATSEDLAGRTIQRDYLRPDGTTVVIEQHQVGVEDGRHFTVCDSAGRPMSTIATRRGFVQFWLDSLPRDPVAWMVADSTSMAEYLLSYDRDDVVTIHVVHNNHIDIWQPGDRELNQNARVLRDIDQFDACVFLTESQRSHLAGIIGPDTGRRFVIPNACRVPDELPSGPRDQYRGVQIGSLIKRKRIDNGIEAVAMAGENVAWGRRPHLDVYGKGHRQEHLQSVIDELRHRPRPALRARLRRWLGRPIGRRVARLIERWSQPPATLRGYSSHAREEFATASVSLLTSRDEAFGLVLVESMGRGCIPISYDIRFGPSEIITDGVDGFLVEPLDKKALAQAIRRVVTMDPDELSRMRAAAHRRAMEFGAEPITRQWAEMLHDLRADRDQALAAS